MTTKKLMVVLSHGGGCDYTIHCGTLVLHQEKDESPYDFINRIMEEYKNNEYDLTIDFYWVEPVKIIPIEKITKYTAE